MSDIVGPQYNVGDALDLQYTLPGVAATDPLVKGWFTVKLAPTDADPGLLQKVVTTGFQVGVGQITDNGAATGTAVILVSLTSADTAALVPYQRYAYDVQVLTASGKPLTVDSGVLVLGRRITQATA